MKKAFTGDIAEHGIMIITNQKRGSHYYRLFGRRALHCLTIMPSLLAPHKRPCRCSVSCWLRYHRHLRSIFY